MACVHHWTIEPAESLESSGVCIRCGATRMFQNVAVRRDDDWRLVSARGPRGLARGMAVDISESRTRLADAWE